MTSEQVSQAVSLDPIDPSLAAGSVSPLLVFSDLIGVVEILDTAGELAPSRVDVAPIPFRVPLLLVG